jgi:hypothetical protein
MVRDRPVTGGPNLLLHALPDAERQRVMSSLTPVFIPVRTVLFEPGRTIDSMEFPRNCVVSLVAPLHRGAYPAVTSAL